MIIKVGGLEPLGPIGVYAYASTSIFAGWVFFLRPTNSVDARKACILYSQNRYA